MKIIMTLLVRDEEDILEANIKFHLNQGVDFIIATDNCSVDSTKDILKKYERMGYLHYKYESSDDYNQHAWVTKMARIASITYNADWVINNDADEFWFPTRHNSLKEAFSSLLDRFNIVQASRNNYIFINSFSSNLPFYQQLIYKEIHSLNSQGKPLPPKQAHKSNDRITVFQGNHSVSGFNEYIVEKNLIDILHFPIRGYKQLVNKINKGGAAYGRNLELSHNIGITWRVLYSELIEKGNIDCYMKGNTYSCTDILNGLTDNTLTIDTRLRDYFQEMHNCTQDIC